MPIHPLKKYRSDHNLSQRELGKLIGCSRPMVGLIEINRRKITPLRAKHYSKILGIPKEVLCPDVFDSDLSRNDAEAG